MKPEWWYYDDWQYQLKKDRKAKRRKLINEIFKILKIKNESNKVNSTI